MLDELADFWEWFPAELAENPAAPVPHLLGRVHDVVGVHGWGGGCGGGVGRWVSLHQQRARSRTRRRGGGHGLVESTVHRRVQDHDVPRERAL